MKLRFLKYETFTYLLKIFCIICILDSKKLRKAKKLLGE